MMTNLASLIQDARNHLNFRTRGMEARLARLAAAGVPTDRDGMAAWLARTLDAQNELAGGVFHACTVRVSNGCDADLPTRNGIGCRISRVPVKAHYVAVGDVVEQDESGGDVLCEEPFFAVQYGNVGVGYMAPTFDHESATAEQAEERARQSLLRKDCFRTRDEARVAVEAMLQERAGA